MSINKTCNGWTNYPTQIIGRWFERDCTEYKQIPYVMALILEHCEANATDVIAVYLKGRGERWLWFIRETPTKGYDLPLGGFFVHGAVVDMYRYMDESNNDSPTKLEIIETVKRGLELVNWQEITQHWL